MTAQQQLPESQGKTGEAESHHPVCTSYPSESNCNISQAGECPFQKEADHTPQWFGNKDCSSERQAGQVIPTSLSREKPLESYAVFSPELRTEQKDRASTSLISYHLQKLNMAPRHSPSQSTGKPKSQVLDRGGLSKGSDTST